MENNPFYQPPKKTPKGPLTYNKENNSTKVNIIEAAKEMGIRKAAGVYNVYNESLPNIDDPLI